MLFKKREIWAKMRTKTRCPSLSGKKVNRSRWTYNLALSLKSLTSWLEIKAPSLCKERIKCTSREYLRCLFTGCATQSKIKTRLILNMDLITESYNVKGLEYILKII